MPFAEADDIGKVYSDPGQQIVALKPLRFSIEAGEYVMITGESGAGKSTLLSLIGALDNPTSGRMCVAGADFSTMNAGAMARFRLHNIGFVFQDFCLVRHLSALGNVRLPLLFSRHPKDDRAETMLRRFNIAVARGAAASGAGPGPDQQSAVAPGR